MKKKRHPMNRKGFALLSILLLPWSGLASATDLERSRLAELVREIDFLLTRVEAIRVDAPDQRRLRFQYNDLNHDLELMREGISDYIAAELRDGRNIAPLKGRYR